MSSIEAKLQSLQRRGGINYSLDRLEEPLHALENPHTQLTNVIHVAGTNGKGSTVAMLATALQLAGHSVATFTSPHLYSYTERFCFGVPCLADKDPLLRPIDETVFEELFHKVFDSISTYDVTEFELLTFMFFRWVLDKQPDYVLLETGLGGRLDSTNVVTPILSIITKIGLDHQEFLGESLEDIASEKAGIIKPGCPVITTEDQLPEVLNVLESVAKQNKSPFYIASSVEGDGPSFLLENLGLVERSVSVLGLRVDVNDVLARSVIPCRFSIEKRYCGGLLVKDVAHNRLGFETSIEAFKTQFLGLEPVIILGISKSRDPKPLLEICQSLSSSVYYIETTHDLLWSYEDIQSTGLCLKKWSKYKIFEETVPYFCLGSFYLFSEL